MKLDDIIGLIIIILLFIVWAIWFFIVLPKKNRQLSKEQLQPCFNRKQCKEVHSCHFEDYPMPDPYTNSGYSNVLWCPICNWSADISTQGFVFEKNVRENINNE